MTAAGFVRAAFVTEHVRVDELDVPVVIGTQQQSP